MPWPAAVPILSPENICQKKHTDPTNPPCHCVSRWMAHLFGVNTEEAKEAITMFNRVAANMELGPDYRWRKVGAMTYLVLVNEANAKEEVARAWNETMYQLGYDHEYYIDKWEEILK